MKFNLSKDLLMPRRRLLKAGWRAFIVLSTLVPMGHAAAKAAILKNVPISAMSNEDRDITADLRVERGLWLLYPQSPSIVLQVYEMRGLPLRGMVSTETRLKLATKEFLRALDNDKRLSAYSASQVHSYLGQAYMQRGREMLKSEEGKTIVTQLSRSAAQKVFNASILNYRAAVKLETGELKYSFAVELIEAIIAAGDLNAALNTIRSFEKFKMKPPLSGDFGLIKIKADILSFQGRSDEASLTYEEWIRMGHTETKLPVGGTLYQKLASLFQLHGHPNNLP
jgi:hypothetical protein